MPCSNSDDDLSYGTDSQDLSDDMSLSDNNKITNNDNNDNRRSDNTTNYHSTGTLEESKSSAFSDDYYSIDNENIASLTPQHQQNRNYLNESSYDKFALKQSPYPLHV